MSKKRWRPWKLKWKSYQQPLLKTCSTEEGFWDKKLSKNHYLRFQLDSCHFRYMHTKYNDECTEIGIYKKVAVSWIPNPRKNVTELFQLVLML